MNKYRENFSANARMKGHWPLAILVILPFILAACNLSATPTNSATPTVNPDIYNQVPDTTVYEPGQCMATLDAPAPAYTSNTLGGEPSDEIPAGEYEVVVVADYGSSLWYALNDAGAANYVNSTSVSSLVGACATSTP
jgi:hypothetical protein